MILWKQPTVAKIYEALGALADGRVKRVSPTSANVVSSSGDKTYTVEWGDDFSWITSNDNASFWQGYLGYPIIAVLLLEGKIGYNKIVSEALKGIPWKELNTRHKNNYDQTIAEVLEEARSKGQNCAEITRECERIQAELKTVKIAKPPQGRKPPVASKGRPLNSKEKAQGDLF
jgi:hypothetical protein